MWFLGPKPAWYSWPRLSCEENDQFSDNASKVSKQGNFFSHKTSSILFRDFICGIVSRGDSSTNYVSGQLLVKVSVKHMCTCMFHFSPS